MFLCTVLHISLVFWNLYRYWACTSLLDLSYLILYGLKSLFFSVSQVNHEVIEVDLNVTVIPCVRF